VSIEELIARRGVGEHFARLEAEAAALAGWLRARIEQAIPGAVIGAYAPNVSLDWFYRGFYRGLSAAGSIELFTFDSEFLAHADLLEERGIHARHSTVLLLSKLGSPDDFSIVTSLLARHDGLWLNRLSRLVEPYDPKAWHALEQTPLSPAERLLLIEHLGRA
jgi:hypothetical protein